MRNLFKKLALSVPPVKKVHTDLENRRRRVAELEGHLQVMKKQMAKVLKKSNSVTLNHSQSSSDINHVKGELKKLNKQHSKLKEKYDALYSDYCVLSMSNEALTKTNASMLNGDFFENSARKPSSMKTKSTSVVSRKKAPSNLKKTSASSAQPRLRKTKTSVRAKQK